VGLSLTAMVARRRLQDAPRAGSLQNVLESVLESAPAPSAGVTRPQNKSKLGRSIGLALLAYVAATNLLALLPGIGSLGFWQGTAGGRVFVPLLKGVTSDRNAVIALAACAILGIVASRIHRMATSETSVRKAARRAVPPGKRLKNALIAAGVLLLILGDVIGPLRVKEVRIELAAEELFRVGSLRVTNSLLSAWLAMAVLIVLALLGRRRLVDSPKPFSLQNILETIFELLTGFMEGIVGQKARAFFPMVCTLFLYILTMDWMGMLPGVGSLGFWSSEGGSQVFTPLLRGATSDLSTTLALAVCAVISLQVYSIRFLGIKDYGLRFIAVGKFREYFHAKAAGEKAQKSLLFRGALDLFVGVLDIFEEITKVFSFSFRLFGNVFAGEVLLLVIAFLAPYLVSIPFMVLELFVGFIQALIFATLTTAFLGKATTSETPHTSPKHNAIVHPKKSAQSERKGA